MREHVFERVCLFAFVAAAPLALSLSCAPQDGAVPPNVGQTPPSATPPGYPPPQQPYPQPYASAAPSGYPPAPSYGPSTPPGYGQQPPPPGSPSANAQTPLGPIMTTDPQQLQAIFTQAASAAQAFLQPPGSAPPPAAPGGPAPAPGGAPPGMTMPGDLVSAGIQVVALMNAKGMTPEGSQAKGQLAEGGHLEFMVPMQAGKCYTLVGFSPPGQIRNLDLNLLAPPFYNILAGQDTTDDNTPVIGKTPNPMCPVVPVPLNYKVDIVARAGSGQVGVQLFSKTK
jgi:hypothetical protein